MLFRKIVGLYCVFSLAFISIPQEIFSAQSHDIQMLGYSIHEQEDPDVSGDGRYVVFESTATNLVSGDDNRDRDIFKKDLQTGAISFVSTDVSGNLGSGHSFEPSISDDGRYVVFRTSSSNLAAGDTNGRQDVFYKDTQTGVITRLSVDSIGTQSNGHSYDPKISANGRYVVFESDATNLIAGDTNSRRDIFWHDTQTGETQIVSVGSGGDPSNNNSYLPTVSSDGRYVVFESDATDLSGFYTVLEGPEEEQVEVTYSNDTNGRRDIFLRDMQLGETTRISVDSLGVQGTGGHSYDAVISDNGQYVVFESQATNLVSGDTNGRRDIFRYEISTGAVQRVSLGESGGQISSNSDSPVISSDGRYVFFHNSNNSIVAGDSGQRDIFRRDMDLGATIEVSLTDGEGQTDGASQYASVSSDGSVVVFESVATNLVSGDVNGIEDIFVRDIDVQTTVRASEGSLGEEVMASHSYNPVISEDGKYVAFQTTSPHIATVDSNNLSDIYLANTQAGSYEKVSLTHTNEEAFGGDSENPDISSDARYVVFESDATNLVAGDTNNYRDIFMRDRQLGATERVSVASDENQSAGGNSRNAKISADGRYVVFESLATNLTVDNNNVSDIFLRDMQVGTTIRISEDNNGNEAGGGSYSPQISENGQYVVFHSDATNLVSGDVNNFADVFIYSVLTDTLEKVSPGTDGDSEFPDISSDGRYVVYHSDATDVVSEDANSATDIFRYDIDTGETVLVSRLHPYVQGNANSEHPSISDNGRYIAYQSDSTNLVDTDTNGDKDVFVFDTQKVQTQRVSLSSSLSQSSDHSYEPVISGDGKRVVFDSLASNIGSGDGNNWSDIFLVLNPLYQNITATSFSIQTTDSQPSALSDQTITFTAQTSFDDNEMIQLQFDSEFSVPSFSVSSVDFSDDGTDLAVGTSCSSGVDVKVVTNTTTNLIAFTNCGKSVVAAGSVIEIQLGENAGGSQQISNPTTQGSYKIALHVDGGSSETMVAIIDGVTITANIDPRFVFSVSGVAAGDTNHPLGSACEASIISGQTTISTTATAMPFGLLNPNESKCASQRLNVSSNTPYGFSVGIYQNQQLTSAAGDTIASYRNNGPTIPEAYNAPSVSIGNMSSYGHLGVSSKDAVLSAGDTYGSGTKFGSISSDPTNTTEIFYHDHTTDGTVEGWGETYIGYIIEVSDLQQAGVYTGDIVYIATPTF